MVGRRRFGGIYSVLTQRDLNTIKGVETLFDSQEDFAADLPLADDEIQGLSIDEIIDGIELYISYLQEERGEFYGVPGQDTYMAETWALDREGWRDIERGLSASQMVKRAEDKGLSRYWEGQLLPVLGKLKRYQRRLQDGELS